MGVQGDSMIEAHIPPGAWIVVDRSLTPNNMGIIVAILDADLTVKHYEREGNKCWLLPANKKYKPIQVKEENRFEVWGVVIHIMHSNLLTWYWISVGIPILAFFIFKSPNILALNGHTCDFAFALQSMISV